MSSTKQTAESGQPGSGQSTTEQAKEIVQESAQQVQEQVGQKAQEMRMHAGERVRQQLDTRSSRAGQQVTATAAAIRRVGQQLRSEGNDGTANYADQVADRAERLGNYLAHGDADRLLRDVENFARRQPLLTALSGTALGFLASRFLKASSASRYRQSYAHDGAPRLALPSSAGGPAATSPAGGSSAEADAVSTGAGRSGGRGQP